MSAIDNPGTITADGELGAVRFERVLGPSGRGGVGGTHLERRLDAHVERPTGSGEARFDFGDGPVAGSVT